ncbi:MULTISPECIES: DUF6020 family protein [unclassified Collinsella]|uniref:DUF6020 family protein n=1 Tax=unclassified Collinsella TaxID=2637548 RepID=UPI0011C1C7A7|nr:MULTISPECIES: DUF6020 family protein [unclassified Collinsella]
MKFSEFKILDIQRKTSILVFVALCSCFIFSFSCSLDSNGCAIWVRSSVLEITAWILAVSLTTYFYILHCSGAQFDLSVYVVSFFIAMLDMLGGSLHKTSSLSPLCDSPIRAVRSIAYALLFTWFIYMLFKVGVYFASNFQRCKWLARANNWIVSQNTVKIGLILIILWLPYLIVFFPGSLPTDTARQLGQWYGARGVALDNHFPYLTTLTYALIYSCGRYFGSNGVASMVFLTVFQTVCGAYVFSISLKRLENAFHSNIALFALLFFGLFPVIPSYVLSISKDYLHALAVLYFCVCLLLFYQQDSTVEQKLSIKCRIEMVISSILVLLTRNNGFVIVFIGLIALLALSESKGFKLFLIMFNVAFFVLWNSFLLPIFGVLPTESGEMLSIPVQMIGRVYQTEKEVPEDLDAQIKCFFDSDEFDIKKAYNPLISDPLKGHLKFDDEHSAIDFAILSLRLACLFPCTSLSGALCTTFAYWYPFTQGTYWMEDAPYYSWDQWSLIDAGWFEGYSWSQEWNDKHSVDSFALNDIHLNSVVSILYKPGFYCWFYLVLICLSSIYKKYQREVTIFCVPMFSLLLSLVAGPCASLRYTLPFIFSLPIAVYLLVNIAGGKSALQE